MFRFPIDPAQITIGGGIEIAWSSLIASAKKWAPVVVVMALVQALPIAIVGTGPYMVTNRLTNTSTWAPGIENKLGLLFLSYFVVVVVSIIGGWIVTAIAVSGLRNKPLTASWIVSAGLQSIVGGILLALAFIVAAIAGFIALAIVARIAGALAIVVGIVEVVALVYVGIRLVFFTIAIFDGFGPISGIEESWNLSERSVVRLFGWGLMAAAIEFGFGLINAVIGGIFDTTGLAIVGTVVAAAITETGAVLILFLMAALYESQRARRAYLSQWGSQPQGGMPYAPYPGGPSAGGWGGPTTGAPYPGQYPGYPPQQYPPQQYPPQQYPPQPGAPDQTQPGGQTPPTGLTQGPDQGPTS